MRNIIMMVGTSIIKKYQSEEVTERYKRAGKYYSSINGFLYALKNARKDTALRWGVNPFDEYIEELVKDNEEDIESILNSYFKEFGNSADVCLETEYLESLNDSCHVHLLCTYDPIGMLCANLIQKWVNMNRPHWIVRFEPPRLPLLLPTDSRFTIKDFERGAVEDFNLMFNNTCEVINLIMAHPALAGYSHELNLAGYNNYITLPVLIEAGKSVGIPITFKNYQL